VYRVREATSRDQYRVREATSRDQYRVREATGQDRDRYNAFVAAQGGHACQCYDWPEAERARGWQPVRLLLEGEAGEIVATAAGSTKRVAGPWSVLDVPWGPVFARGSEEALRAVLSALQRLARGLHAIHLRVGPEQERDPRLEALLRQWGFGLGVPPWRYQATWRIDLREDLDCILARMGQRTRGGIRRAPRMGCEVSTEESEEGFAAFLSLYQDTYRRRGHTPQREAYLRALWSLPGMRKLFVARHHGQPVHALLLYTFGRRVWHGMSGSAAGTRLPGQSVRWAAITWAKEHGFEEYDLGGKPREHETSEAHRGIYLFKRGFGGREVELMGEFGWSPSPAHAWAFRQGLALRDRMRARRRRNVAREQAQG
jgi:peptidoglycan pentaglycine glycine transferase (the first glycine)